MSGLGYPNVEITKSEYKRFRNTLERKLLLNLFALSNHPAEILSEKDVSDKQNEKTLLIESALFTPLIKEETLIVDEESSNLLKSTATGLETGWQIVGTFESELKVVTGYLKVPETAPTKQ
jgi:primosomal protein N'